MVAETPAAGPPQQWQEIVEANNQRPPMWLRVNRNHHSRMSGLSLLNETGLEGFTHPDYPDAVRPPPLPRSTRYRDLMKVG